MIDEATSESLAIQVPRGLRSGDVLDVPRELFVEREAPEYIRSANGAEFAAKAVREWLVRTGFTTPREARILVEWWRREHHQVRPSSAMGCRPPAPLVVAPVPAGKSA